MGARSRSHADGDKRLVVLGLGEPVEEGRGGGGEAEGGGEGGGVVDVHGVVFLALGFAGGGGGGGGGRMGGWR